jgi:hypothetical protein
MNNKKSEENDKIEVSNVYEMFEEVKALEEKQLTSIEKLCSKLATVSESESTPALTPEDGQKIETLAEKLNSVGEKLDRPLRHHHTLDFMGNRALIGLAAAVGAFLVSLWIIHNQRDTIARNRDNDLKYRYIQMRGEATPADILRLRNVFDFNRNPDSIKIIRRQVEEYERLIREQTESAARAKFNATEAERLQNQAETVKGGK